MVLKNFNIFQWARYFFHAIPRNDSLKGTNHIDLTNFFIRIQSMLWNGMNMEIPPMNPMSSISISPSPTDRPMIILEENIDLLKCSNSFFCRISASLFLFTHIKL